MARLVEARADGDHAAQGALATSQRRDPLVVHPILEVDDDAIRLGKEADREQRRPIGVVALNREEDGVKWLVDRLCFEQLQSSHLDDVVAARAA